MKRRQFAGVLFVFAAACGRNATDTPAAPKASAGEVAPVAGAQALPTAASAKPAARTWKGDYASVAGTLYVPPDWKNVRWASTNAEAGLGDGTIDLTIDPTTGRVGGAIGGPLGPATIDGYAADGTVTGTIRRSDPTDRGFTGTLSGGLTDAGAEGTLRVSLAEANAIRTAPFKLTEGAPR